MMDMEVDLTEADRGKKLEELTFYRQNKRGKPLKICREKYLRNDLNCGVSGCQLCPITKLSVFKLDPKPQIFSTKFTMTHYLLPDVEFILRQVDILEELQNVILLQIVMEQVYKINSAKYRRIRNGLKNRKSHYFLNEHHMATYVSRKPTETVDERNRRAFVTAYLYFVNHFVSSNVGVIILSDDPEFGKNHFYTSSSELTSKPIVANCIEYVENMTSEFRDLDDKICRVPFDKDEEITKYGKGDSIYPPHLEAEVVDEGIKSGKYLQGPYRSMNFYEGSVRVECENDEKKDILLQGLSSINRATDGDIVAIELFSKEEWSVSSGLVVLDEDEEEVPLGKEAVATGNEIEEEIFSIVKNARDNANNANDKSVVKQPTGRVVGIVKRKWQPCCGVILRSTQASSSYHFFLPDNKKLPRIKIETRNVDRFDGQKILIQIDYWPATSRNPIGHYLKILGKAGDIETETAAILYEHGISHEPFSKAVEACCPNVPFSIPECEYNGARKDFRNKIICSVDPVGCTDIDDALHCELNDDGTYEVGVHIADVSYFVKPDTALDEEAAKRGTSVYLADRRIDMIPPIISSNIASLHPGVDKLVFSVIWKLSSNAEILETNFYKGIINTKGALTYGEAQKRLDKKLQDPISKSLTGLSYLAQTLKKKRFENGALMLSSKEVNEDGVEDEDEESHSMVEEFMLLANCTVAEFIVNTYTEYALLRRHPTAPPANFIPLLLAAKAQGLNIIVDQGSKLLNDTIQASPKDIRSILCVLTTRCMTQALYYCSGTTSPDDFRHFGLAVKLYTHFTSPIRRYADLMVHRLLAGAIQYEDVDPRILDSKKMNDICENINTRHKMAQYAQRASINFHKSKFLENNEEENMGYIMFIRRNALQVFVPKYTIEGFVFYPKGGNFVFDEKEVTVTFDNEKLQALQKVTVKLSREKENGKVAFKLVTPKIPGFSID